MRAGVTVVDPATTWIDATVTPRRGRPPAAQHPAARRHARGAGRRRRPGHHPDRRPGRRGRHGDPHPRLRRHDRRRTPASGPSPTCGPAPSLGETGKIGAFYETKNVTIGRGSKLSHLGYAGDAEIGEDTNIGCGNITANYDGEKKHRTVIGSGVRTGSNTVFVAPVQVGDGAYTGAGAVIRKDVPAGALAVSAGPQRNVEGWVLANRPGTVSASAGRGRPAPPPSSSSTPAPTEEG